MLGCLARTSYARLLGALCLRSVNTLNNTLMPCYCLAIACLSVCTRNGQHTNALLLRGYCVQERRAALFRQAGPARPLVLTNSSTGLTLQVRPSLLAMSCAACACPWYHVEVCHALACTCVACPHVHPQSLVYGIIPCALHARFVHRTTLVDPTPPPCIAPCRTFFTAHSLLHAPVPRRSPRPSTASCASTSGTACASCSGSTAGTREASWLMTWAWGRRCR